ncbi:facilitated trehalose transporter Tret1-like [Leptinotarsa decemlineata]|uniref:facilitated trehalose transporter Tret1-like n=1 Tax=Leptinotarsa decemlineata TaxID=7539 RepID=UPI003D306F4E
MFFPQVNKVYLSMSAASILMIINGISLSWSSPSMPKLTNCTTNPFGRDISTSEVTWISSLVPIGASVGPFLFGWMTNKFGRKFTILSFGVPFLISYLMMAFSTTVEVFYVARFVVGVTLGGCFTVLPNYLGEVAEKRNRGALGSCMGIAVAIGLFFSYCVGPYVSVMVFNLIIAFLPASFLVIFSLVGEECAHYHLSRNEVDMAREVLYRLRGNAKKETTDLELEEIKARIDEDGSGNFLDIFRSRGFTKAFVTVIALLTFQQACGSYLVFFYSQTLFQQIGTDLPPEICSIILGATLLLSSFTSPPVVDRFGRRKTLMMSTVGIMVSETFLGVYVYLQDQGVDVSTFSFLPLLALTVFILMYNNGLGPLPYTVMGEIFPSKVKVPASAVAVCFSYVLGFVVTKYFEFFFVSFGMAQSFWLFAFCMVFCLVFGQFYLIETGGRV